MFLMIQLLKNLSEDASYLEYFSLLFDRDLMNIIVSETNKFFVFSGDIAEAKIFIEILTNYSNNLSCLMLENS